MRDKKKHIEQAIAMFDFDRAQSVMEFLGWEWTTLGHIPRVADLKTKAVILLTQVAEKEGKTRNISGGGLKASYIRGELGDYLALEFIVTNCDTEGL